VWGALLIIGRWDKAGTGPAKKLSSQPPHRRSTRGARKSEPLVLLGHAQRTLHNCGLCEASALPRELLITNQRVGTRYHEKSTGYYDDHNGSMPRVCLAGAGLRRVMASQGLLAQVTGQATAVKWSIAFSTSVVSKWVDFSLPCRRATFYDGASHPSSAGFSSSLLPGGPPPATEAATMKIWLRARHRNMMQCPCSGRQRKRRNCRRSAATDLASNYLGDHSNSYRLYHRRLRAPSNSPLSALKLA